jgi:hypothetical protein
MIDLFAPPNYMLISCCEPLRSGDLSPRFGLIYLNPFVTKDSWSEIFLPPLLPLEQADDAPEVGGD